MDTNTILAVLAALLVVCPAAVAGEPPKVDPDVAKVVQDLGSPRFAVREAAAQKLGALGGKAKVAVFAGTKDADPEVARRCEAVLPQLRAAERKALLDGTGDWPAPGGVAFKALVGDTKEARKLFVKLTEDDRLAALVDAATGDPDGAARLYAAEVARLVAALKRAQAHDPALAKIAANREQAFSYLRESHRLAVSSADVALVLYLGSSALPDAAPEPPEVAELLRPAFFDVATGPQRQPFAKLFAAWLDRRRDPEVVRAGLEAALVSDVSEAVPIARRVAADREQSAMAVGTAVQYLGRHGTKADLVLLSAVRADDRLFCVLDPRTGDMRECEVRDLATAASLALRGQDVSNWFTLRDWTVWWVPPGPQPVKIPTRLSEVGARRAAPANAWEWLDQQPGAPPKPSK
jgi:hypothetical protein